MQGLGFGALLGPSPLDGVYLFCQDVRRLHDVVGVGVLQVVVLLYVEGLFLVYVRLELVELLLRFRAQLNFLFLCLRDFHGFRGLDCVRNGPVDEFVQTGLGDLRGLLSELFQLLYVVSVLLQLLNDFRALLLGLGVVFEALETLELDQERLVLLLFALCLLLTRFLGVRELLELRVPFQLVLLFSSLQLLVAQVLPLFKPLFELLVFLRLELYLLQTLFFELERLFGPLLVLLQYFLQFLLLLLLALLLKLLEALFLFCGRDLPLRWRDDRNLCPRRADLQRHVKRVHV